MITQPLSMFYAMKLLTILYGKITFFFFHKLDKFILLRIGRLYDQSVHKKLNNFNKSFSKIKYLKVTFNNNLNQTT